MAEFSAQPRRMGEGSDDGGRGNSVEKKVTYNSAATELLPDSYRMNSAVELQLLSIADIFQRQFSVLYPSRMPLLLCPVNECGVQKFVCTTLQPSSSSQLQLFSWQRCATFVADVLILEPLEPPTDLPRSLSSPSSVLQRRTASCFESATLLCSLLLGANYDAYCVSGYADKEMCLLDQSLEDCPLQDGPLQDGPLQDSPLQDSPLQDGPPQHVSLQDLRLEDSEDEISEQEQQEFKYCLRRDSELESRYLRRLQESKTQEEEGDQLHSLKLQQEREQQPHPDALHGLRVHCWVLVLSGRRGVDQNFFIDPLSGNSFPTHSCRFLGIESVWNQFNYYTNMQDCRGGCGEIVFNLRDLKFWEPLLLDEVSRSQLLDEENKDELQIRVFDMPTSWVSQFTPTELENCLPGGQKQTLYWKSKLERFAPRLRTDGLTTRWTTYRDVGRTEVATVRERFLHRADLLQERELDTANGHRTERFLPGKAFHLLSLTCRPQSCGEEHDIEFSFAQHADHIRRRLLTPHQMCETFEGRGDFLYYRQVVFSQPFHIREQALKDMLVLDFDVPLKEVVERFHRNESIPANEDVAQRVFMVSEQRIQLTHHLMESRVVPSRTYMDLSSLKHRPFRGIYKDLQMDLARIASSLPKTFTQQTALEEERKMKSNVFMSLAEVAAIRELRERDEQQKVKLLPKTSQRRRSDALRDCP